MFLVDTHCHITSEYFADNFDEMLCRAAEAQVRRMIIAASDIATSYEGVSIASKFTNEPEIFASVGVHPHMAENVAENYLSEIRALCNRERVCAVGEIGLDYFYNISPRNVQIKVLREQLILANELKMPVIIHVRDAKEKADGDAWRDLLNIIRETGKTGENAGVIHCFTGRQSEAEAALEMGYYISFAGPLTYKNNMTLREIASTIPIDRLLCETDSPYLAPQGFRGQKNEPRHVRAVYECLSMLKSMSLEEFSAPIKHNCEKLFNIRNGD